MPYVTPIILIFLTKISVCLTCFFLLVNVEGRNLGAAKNFNLKCINYDNVARIKKINCIFIISAK